MTQHQLTLDSDGLALAAILHVPADSVSSASSRPLQKIPGVVVCHPHPRYGGDMNSGVVAGLAECLQASGIAALRFNHRGVAGSEGEFAGGGDGALADARSALEELSLDERVDATRVGIAGYSFGASVALQASLDSDSVQAIAAIACPVGVFKALGARELLQPKLLVLGDRDHDFPADQFRFLARRYSEPKQVSLISGADHFFQGHESTLGEMAAEFFAKWLVADGAAD
jgi:alpha/beta superfamily hydrolase